MFCVCLHNLNRLVTIKSKIWGFQGSPLKPPVLETHSYKVRMFIIVQSLTTTTRNRKYAFYTICALLRSVYFPTLPPLASGVGTTTARWQDILGGGSSLGFGPGLNDPFLRTGISYQRLISFNIPLWDIRHCGRPFGTGRKANYFLLCLMIL